METADDAPVNLCRADFIALANGALAIGFLLLSGWTALADGISLETGVGAIVGFLLLATASYTHFRPEATNRGTDPAPRLWFELAGVIAVCLLLTVIGGYLLLDFIV